jgi:DNA recombination protein RmuC
MEWVLLLAGLAAGALLAWILAGRRGGAPDGGWRARAEALATELAEKNRLLDAAREREVTQRERIAGMEATAAQLNAQIGELRESLERARNESEQLRRDLGAAQVESAELRTALDKERSGAEEKIAVLTQAREELSNQFKALANDILEQKSKTFTEQNQTNLTNLLNPLKDKFGEFQLKVEELKTEHISGRSELREQISNLKSLNERLSADAESLVTALKGSSKTQGDWGEFVLEKLLQAAGLRKGIEYRVQETFSREDGSDARVDFILDLPDDRHVVIDSKVSLNDYRAYCNSDDTQIKKDALKRHLACIRAHVKELSERRYQELYSLNTLDFVLMFFPIEPAFLLAISNDDRLWQDAWDRNVVLVSPSGVFPVARSVAQVWRQERQARGVEEIVKRGKALYEKLVGFAEDLLAVGESLRSAQDSYDEACRKLTSGKGNVIRQAEMLKSLGVKPAKNLPLALVEQAMDEDEPLALAAVGEEISDSKPE